MKGYSKYRAIKTEVDGITFDSKKEAEAYKELKLLEAAGYITDLKLQVPFVLFPKSKWGRELKYIADFVYYDTKLQKKKVIDVKGFRTDVYKLKKRIVEELYGIEVEEI